MSNELKDDDKNNLPQDPARRSLLGAGATVALTAGTGLLTACSREEGEAAPNAAATGVQPVSSGDSATKAAIAKTHVGPGQQSFNCQ